jgi:hypothetical protein
MVSNKPPCAWYSRLSHKLQSLGFIPSKAEMPLFFYRKASIVMYVLVYVDDITIAISSPKACPKVCVCGWGGGG